MGIATVDTQKWKNEKQKQKKLVAYYSQGLPRWISRPPGGPNWGRNWGRNWGKIGENWEKIIGEWGKIWKLSSLAHPTLPEVESLATPLKKVTKVFIIFNVLWNVPLLKIKGIYANIWEKIELQIRIDKLKTALLR